MKTRLKVLKNEQVVMETSACEAVTAVQEALSPLVEVVDFRHVSKQDLLFVLQRSRDEGKHGRIVHLRGIALKTQPAESALRFGHRQRSRCPPGVRRAAPPRRLSRFPAAHS